ncbi:Kinase-like protein [Coniochaeta hoffmannii]|uniref:Kinase-like protein n=1 Tax=Coniochaeta hoffmannii TaxID=91930 RepID=A0AA38RAK5_9PEZI|nr:Kinase-like protein [Coniochaeta hoffmannii]
MAALPSIGQVLKGRASAYTIVKELHRAVDNGVVFLATNLANERFIVKSIAGHWRLRNEADILKRYQLKTPFLRPLVDELQDPAEPPSIVLKYLDSDLLTESNKKRLSRPDIKRVAKCLLETLRVLHSDGLVHTDVKLDNVFVDLGPQSGGQRFSAIQLGDCGGVVSQDSMFARDGHLIGAGFTRSPEATFRLPWGTATDIWSFGNAVLSLLYGGGYHLFNPGIEGLKVKDQENELTVLKRMYKFFGPYPQSCDDFNDSDTIPEIPPADKAFILKIMKLDPRDRPTADQLLEDEWFTEESEDTRVPLPEEESPS